MWKIYLVFYSILFFCNSIIAQHLTQVPDSLKKYSYDELMDKIVENYENNEINYKKRWLYAQANLLKAQKEKNTLQIIYGYNTKAETINNLEQALKYSDTAIAIAKTKISYRLPFLYFRRGNLYYNQKRLKEALNYYLMASHDTVNTSINWRNNVNYSIAVIKSTQGNYDEALPIYIKCEETARLNKLPNYLIYLFGLAEVCNRTNHIELSEQCTNKGLALRKTDTEGDFYYPYFIANRGKNYYKRKQYDKAIQDLTCTLKIIKDDDDFSNYAESSYFIGECYRKLQQDDKAIVYYKKVDSIFTAKKDIYPVIIPAYEHLIAYYKKKQNYKQVVYYSDQFIKADKVIDENYKYITSKIAKTYDIQKIIFSKQALIASLKSDKKMSFVTNVLLLLGIVVLGILLYWNNRRKQRELQKQKELFEAYRRGRKQKAEIQVDEKMELDTNISKKFATENINESVINQILSSLDQFEKEQWYLNKEYTVETLATEFKTNSNYLSKVINEIKGCSFTNYINKLRIEYILEKLESDKNFLKYTVLALSEISGYQSVQTFTRAFTAYTKMKPSDFVKELINRNL